MGGGEVFSPLRLLRQSLKEEKCNDSHTANFSYREIMKVSVLRKKLRCLDAVSSRKKNVNSIFILLYLDEVSTPKFLLKCI